MRDKIGTIPFLVGLLLACESYDPPTAPRDLALPTDPLPTDSLPTPTRTDAVPIPIMDGGGLYGGGSNTPPAAHIAAGLAAAAQVPASGAVFTSLGMSLTKNIFDSWRSTASTDVIMVNGACGGCVVSAWTSLTRVGWQNAFQQLALAGLTGDDVDVVWMSVTKQQNVAATQADLERIFAAINQAYPNVRQVFVSNRTYGGYRTTGSAEPMAWQDGVAVKQFVLNHLGETDPWVGWAGDLWANGETPRSDGLQWFRADFKDDGLHYSPIIGTPKVGALARDQFEASPFTGWYQR